MAKKLLSSICTLLIACFSASINAQISFSEDDVCGIYTVAELSALDLEPFGNAGSDWSIVQLADPVYELTISKIDDGQLLLTNFFPLEGGNLVGTYNSEDNSITFQPQKTLGEYTFCAYPSVGDWYVNNKLQEAPQPIIAKFNLEKTLSFGMWALIKGDIDVVATCYQSGKFYFSRQSGVEDISIYSAGIDDFIYDLMGNRSAADNLSSLPSGIYIYRGKKIIIR